MLENIRIFIPEKVLICTCVEMPVGFTNVASTTNFHNVLYVKKKKLVWQAVSKDSGGSLLAGKQQHKVD